MTKTRSEIQKAYRERQKLIKANAEITDSDLKDLYDLLDKAEIIAARIANKNNKTNKTSVFFSNFR